MLDEEMDNMIREAAAKHHPTYDNTAWDKMQLLLNKHLPQKKDRRRFFLFLLIFFLLVGGGFFTRYYFGEKKKNTVANIASKPATLKPSAPAIERQNVSAPLAAIDNPNINVQQPEPSSGDRRSTIPVKTTLKDKNNLARATKTFIEEITAIAITNTAAESKEIEPILKKVDAIDIPVVQEGKKDPAVIADIVKQKEEVKEKFAEFPVKKPVASSEKKRSSHSIAGNFGLRFSAGPDLSFVELNKPGKITLAYGIGLSYTFAKKITLETGLYVSRKIYSSDSAAYHPPAVFWSYYPNLENINANCKVYEIPVNLLYNFGQKRNHNWFAGAGLSSYIMKRETYDYTYKYAGQSYSRSYTISNTNQHNFSVLTLTGGYQYNINKNVSISAEPYIKLPLSGIGFGKVKLKGGGLMFNATIKPFAKKK